MGRLNTALLVLANLQVEAARGDGPHGLALDIVAVGTAGLRQASNGRDSVAAVHARCGVTVEAIQAGRRPQTFTACRVALALTKVTACWCLTPVAAAASSPSEVENGSRVVEPRVARCLHRAVRARRRRTSRDSRRRARGDGSRASHPWAADPAPAR